MTASPCLALTTLAESKVDSLYMYMYVAKSFSNPYILPEHAPTFLPDVYTCLSS